VPIIPILFEIPGIKSKIMTAKSFANLPDTIFCIIIEYLDWYDVGKFDTALLKRNARNIYLDTLKLRKVKVGQNLFWSQAVEKGILNWLVSRDIRVVSWDLQVDDTKLMTIATGCPQLQSLNSSHCDNITDEGIIALANGCPQLQSLDISRCDKITDEGIIALATGCPQLQSLIMSYCHNITDEGIRALATGLPQLQSLEISQCRNITDEGIRALASGCAQLQSLNITGCNNITDEGIRAVATGCPQLQSLKISGCDNITAGGREIAKSINSKKIII